MAQNNIARHSSNCPIAAQSPVIAASDSTPNVPMQKRKEDAKQILYLNRI